MALEVDLRENENVQVTEFSVEISGPGTVTFTVEGTLRTTAEIVGTFEGATVNPAQVELSMDDSGTVAIDLQGEASLRLESVDVGLATPGSGDFSADVEVTDAGSLDSPDAGELAPSGEGVGERSESGPVSLAFTVEGTVREVPEETVGTVREGSATLETVTFAVEDTTVSDGGTGTDVLLEIGLFGYSVVVRRDGSITVGSGGGGSSPTVL